MWWYHNIQIAHVQEEKLGDKAKTEFNLRSSYSGVTIDWATIATFSLGNPYNPWSLLDEMISVWIIHIQVPFPDPAGLIGQVLEMEMSWRT